jgi:hypothetical protein
MAVIPTYTRQSSIPGTTGVPAPPVVPIDNQAVKAGFDFFQQVGKVGDNLFEAQASSELTSATTNAQLKLHELETDLNAKPGIDALSGFSGRSVEIYKDITKTMHPKIRVAFDKKWGLLSGKSQISVRSTATKRAYSEMAGDLHTNLDALVDGFGPSGDKITWSLAITTGVDAIKLAVSKHIITSEAGAKLKLKFVQDVAENGVTGWINDQTVGTMVSAFRQMDEGKFTDSNIGMLWSGLDEKRKATLTGRAITNISRSLKLGDDAERRKDNNLKISAQGQMVNFYREKTDEKPEDALARRRGIIDDLAKNKMVNPGTFNQMIKDVEGRTDRFLVQKDSIAIRKKILMTPHSVTLDEIITYNGTDQSELMTMFTARMNARTSRAREIVKSSPAFVPANMVEARMKGDVFDAAQANIWTTVLTEMVEARDKGEAFDPVGRANKLIEEFEEGEKNDQTKDIAAAVRSLNSLGITTKKDLDSYRSRHMGTLSPEALNNLRKWESLVFTK